MYIGCFGSGLGHATRMLEIADLLRTSGVQVRFSSSGEVVDFVERRGYKCNRLPLADVQYGENGEMSLRATMAESPKILARTYRQVYLEVGNLKGFQPDLVLSDSAISTVFAARSLKLRVYTILNQLNLNARTSNAGVGVSLLSGGTSAGVAKIWEMSEAILLPDLPPPYTISESSLWAGKVKSVRYIGFLTGSEGGGNDAVSSAFKAEPRPKVFWQVSGPPQTRGPFIRAAKAIASALAGVYAFVVTEGDPNASRVPVRIKGGWAYGWCGVSQAYFDHCNIVVSRAGHGTIARAITASKPSLLVPITNQSEQEGNAAKAAKLGVSITVKQESLNVESFRRAVEALSREPYPSRAARLGKIARNYDAKRTITSLVSSVRT
ncbi:MAG: hypothetical protein LYZ70_00350 [Nitrososphaerales archaeon]|nr:hypothetical protein [Nitrososphaerales archaeon]